MKKILFVMFAAALSFASCGTKTTDNATDTDSTAVATEEIAELQTLADAVETGDAAQTQTALTALQSRIQELIESGDLETAKKYKYQLEKWYNENKSTVDGIAQEGLTVEQLINLAENTPASTEELATSAVEAAKADAQQVKEEVKAKAQEKANEAVQQATQQAAQKTNEAATKAVNKLLGK